MQHCRYCGKPLLTSSAICGCEHENEHVRANTIDALRARVEVLEAVQTAAVKLAAALDKLDEEDEVVEAAEDGFICLADVMAAHDAVEQAREKLRDALKDGTNDKEGRE